MAIDTLRAVGFCAHYSKQGDWAFNYALRLSQSKSLKLNVFHFMADPYDPDDTTGKDLSPQERNIIAIEKERKLRMYYDELAGSYLDVGFRLCFDNEWTELHRCLVVREFQVLALGFLDFDANFAGKKITDFADSFISPVVLVGPNSPDQFYLNTPASMIAHKLALSNTNWVKIEKDFV